MPTPSAAAPHDADGDALAPTSTARQRGAGGDALAPTSTVAVLLVSHDGATWLPGVLDGLRAQDGALAAVVAVDTGSTDDSAELLGPHADVVTTPSSTTYPQAVRLGLERLDAQRPPGADPPEWVWLLHDDSRPAPGALAALLAAAEVRPDVDVLGPKLREWPSLLRLLEVGVTISGTGRRETGLEPGEYDQGQHDEPREVLAVNTAGMLVRRSVLDELGGFDEQLPLFGNDVDFGWRAVAAGHTTMVVPEAVVFHAEAAHRGGRRTALTGRRTHYHERRAALYTLLVNGRAVWLPLQTVRLVLGTVLRMLGFALVRSPGEALDDLAALASVLSRPGRLRAARRDRRTGPGGSAGGVDRSRVRRLLAPPWLPYRHGLDFLGDVASALTLQAADVAERRRAAAAERDPSSQAAARLRAEQRAEQRAEEEGELTDSGAVARYLTNPVALVLTAVVLVALVGARTALGSVSGGALSPVPDAAGDWWSLHLDGWHALGFGTDVPAPAYVPVLALLATVLGTTWAVSLLLVLAVPVALGGAWRFLGVVGLLGDPRGAPRWLLVAGATTWAVVPVTTGAWGGGRLGLVVATALLPWLAHAALGFADPDPDRRRRAGWRVGGLLTLTTAFAPATFWLATALAIVALACGAAAKGRAATRRAWWGPPVTALLVPVLLLLPWWLPAVTSGAAEALFLEAGQQPAPAVGPLDLLTGQLTEYAAPGWVGWLLPVLALAALAPRTSRVPVTLCWLVVLVSAAVAVVLGLGDLSLAGGTTPVGAGALVVTAQAALVTAVVLGGQVAVRTPLPGAGERVARRAAGTVVAVAGAVLPLAGLGWFLVGDDALTSEGGSPVPAYMVQSAETGPEHGVLVLRGDVESGLRYLVRRGDGVTLGEAEVMALAGQEAGATVTVSELVARPTGRTVADVGSLGIEWILLAQPADGRVAATLDATSGLTQVSSQPGSRAWQVSRPLDASSVVGDGSALRPVLLLVQGAGLLVVLVLCAPTVRSRRSR